MQPWQPAVCRIPCGGPALQVITVHARRHRGISFGSAGDWEKKEKIEIDIKHGSLHLLVKNLNACNHPTSHCCCFASVNNLHPCWLLHFKVCFVCSSSALTVVGLWTLLVMRCSVKVSGWRFLPWGYVSHECDESRAELTVIGSRESRMLRSFNLQFFRLKWIRKSKQIQFESLHGIGCLPFELTGRTCPRYRRHRWREAFKTSGHKN